LEAKTPFFSAPFKMYANLKKYKELLKHFIFRDLKVRYHNSFIGYGWSVLEPLALTITFYILFAILSDDVDPYRPLTILLGILTWTLFAKTLLLGTTGLQRNASLIKRVYFPRELFLFSKSGYQIIQIALSLFVIVPLLIHYELVPTRALILLPVAVLLISMLALGLAFITSILQTKARDIEHIVTIFLRISFYLTPVFYPLNMITGGRVPEEYVNIYLLINPMATYISMIRTAFTGVPLGIPVENLVFTVSSTVVLFWVGTIYFMRNERKAVKNL
jgi:ABC-type polysaccharide/polyol phosphate export permease